MLSISIEDFFQMKFYKQIEDRDVEEITQKNKVLLIESPLRKYENLKKKGNTYHSEKIGFFFIIRK